MHRMAIVKAMKVVGLLAVLTFAFWCWSLTGLDLVRTEAYEAYSDASTSGAIESGWLPREMPVSAKKILETHDADTSEMWIRFTADAEGIEKLLDRCTASTAVELPNKRTIIRVAPWWPEPLTAGNEVAASGGQWTLHSCPEMRHAQQKVTAGVAVNRASGTVWYWVN